MSGFSNAYSRDSNAGGDTSSNLYPVENILYLADSYKISHHFQYPPGTEYTYSYFESRGGKFPEICFFGLQYLIKRWLCGCVVTDSMITEAKEFYVAHFQGQDKAVFNEQGWRYIVAQHGGSLPIKIKAVPEGLIIPTRNVLFTVENTDPKVPWLTNWLETLLVQVWYPMTVCTNSRAQKELIARYLDETSDSLATLTFKLHDFGYRGCSSIESAAIGGAAHLVNFEGTDNIAGIRLCHKYYGASGPAMAGFSIPAAEHSTMTAWGRHGETDACRNMLQQFPTGTVAVVSDSYDIFKCVEKIWGTELCDMVAERGKTGGVLVIRPDSGDPAKTVLKVLELLGKCFNTHRNSKGYRMLPSYVRVIQGDGISYESLGQILGAVKMAEWSVENLSFGSGGSLLQKLDRDTQKCAFKCSHVVVNGEPRDVYKDPITDPGKVSKKGRLALRRVHNFGGTGKNSASGIKSGSDELNIDSVNVSEYVTMQQCSSGSLRTSSHKRSSYGSNIPTVSGEDDDAEDVMVTVYENGKLLVDWSLTEIRSRAQIGLISDNKPLSDGPESSGIAMELVNDASMGVSNGAVV